MFLYLEAFVAPFFQVSLNDIVASVQQYLSRLDWIKLHNNLIQELWSQVMIIIQQTTKLSRLKIFFYTLKFFMLYCYLKFEAKSIVFNAEIRVVRTRKA